MDYIRKEKKLGNSFEETLQEPIQKTSKSLEIKQNNVLNKIFEIEKPSQYQKIKIIGILREIINEMDNTVVKNGGTVETIVKINDALTKKFEINSDVGDAILLKSIYPEKVGEKPIGNLDCDSRCLLVYGVMQELGREKELALVEMTGHVQVYLPESQVFFETLDGTTKKAVELSEKQLLEMNILDSLAKIQSLAFSNMATSLANEIKMNSNPLRLFGKSDPNFDIEFKRKEMEDCFQKAFELDFDQVTLRKNYITTHKLDSLKYEELALIYRSIIVTLETNYKKRLNLIENNFQNSEMKINKVSDLGDVISPSSTVRQAYYEYGMFCLYDKKDYAESNRVFEKLFSVEKISANILNLLDGYFSGKDYGKFIAAYGGNYAMLLNDTDIDRRDIDGLESKYLVSSIITGKIKLTEVNRNEFVNKYANKPLIRGFFDEEKKLDGGYWNIRQADAVEALKSWEGFEQFKKILLDKKD